MGAKNGLLVEVVGIRLAPARVVCWEAQRIEVLLGGDNREKIVVVFVNRTRETRFDDRPR